MYYDFTDVSSNTINSTHSKYLPQNLYNNPKLIDVDGINKNKNNHFFHQPNQGAHVDCPLAYKKMCSI